MLKHLRTTTENNDFQSLTRLLDSDLSFRYGALQKEYDNYNKMDHLDTVVIAYENDQAVGCGCFKSLSDNTVEIKRMFVHPDFRKRGIARSIMSSLEIWALERGNSKCILETGKKQLEAIALYEKLGYRTIENFGPYINHSNSVCMMKTFKKVLLFLSQGFEAYEASVFTDVIGWSRECGFEPVGLVTTGLRSLIKCYWNLLVQPEIPFEQVNVDDYDALAIPGGAEDAGFFVDAYDERFLNLIREFDQKGKLIASICVAAMPLGKSGVLKNRNATTWDLNEGVRRQQLADFGARVQDMRLVIDKNIITSTGPATSLDVAFQLLEMLTSAQNVHVVKRNMRFNLERRGA